MFHMHMIRARDTRFADLLGRDNQRDYFEPRSIILAGTERQMTETRKLIRLNIMRLETCIQQRDTPRLTTVELVWSELVSAS